MVHLSCFLTTVHEHLLQDWTAAPAERGWPRGTIAAPGLPQRVCPVSRLRAAQTIPTTLLQVVTPAGYGT
eukprot:4324850-Prymnesium_polylepis.1